MRPRGIQASRLSKTRLTERKSVYLSLADRKKSERRAKELGMSWNEYICKLILKDTTKMGSLDIVAAARDAARLLGK